MVKNPPAMQETQVPFLGQEKPLEKGKATHFSILAWRIPWTTVRGVTKNRKELLKLEHTLVEIYNKEVNYRRDNS